MTDKFPSVEITLDLTGMAYDGFACMSIDPGSEQLNKDPQWAEVLESYDKGIFWGWKKSFTRQQLGGGLLMYKALEEGERAVCLLRELGYQPALGQKPAASFCDRGFPLKSPNHILMYSGRAGSTPGYVPGTWQRTYLCTEYRWRCDLTPIPHESSQL